MVLKKEDSYLAAMREIEIRLQNGGDTIADLGNISAVLKKRLKFFWVGFYFYRGNHLVLGPFQGTPACTFLSVENGVCASCVKLKKPIIVPDVRQFQGHIACDPDSRSEIAVPLYDHNEELRGVLDIDSDRVNAFDDVDRSCIEKIEKIIRSCWDNE
jgi:GAF domain-containing protein